MKEKSKTLLLTTLSGIGIACAIFCIECIILDIAHNGSFQMEHYTLTKMAIGTLIIGLGFGIPAIIYDNDNMPVGVQTLIHMGIGCTVLTITAFIVGWIPIEKGIVAVVLTIAGEITVAFIIWFFFYAHNKKLAKNMNEKIAEVNR